MANQQQDIAALGGEAVRVALDEKGILTLTLDMPGRSANVLNDSLSAPLAALVERIESDDAVKGVIITSAKKDFLVGATSTRSTPSPTRPRPSAWPMRSRACCAGWRPVASRWRPRSTARRWAVAWSWRWPVTTGWRWTRRR